MTSVTIGTAATVSPLEQSAHIAQQTPASTAVAPTGASTAKISISFPNPSLRLDYQLGLVVIEFRDASGSVTRTIPSAQQLAAYQQWTETGAGTNPLSLSLAPTAATGSTVSPHQVGIPLTGAGTATGSETNTGSGGNAPAPTPSGSAGSGSSAPATPTPTGPTTTSTVPPVGGTTDATTAVTVASAAPAVAPAPPTTTVAADQPAH